MKLSWPSPPLPKDCDLCRKPVEPGEPRFGANGDGGVSGAPFGFDRHWSCHTAKYGKAKRRDLASDLRNAARTPPGKPVLQPKVRKGSYNLSSNAARDFAVLLRERAMGKTRIYIECPFCFYRFWAYVWSISGGGKKCPNCGAIHASFGTAAPIEGNEDLSE